MSEKVKIIVEIVLAKDEGNGRTSQVGLIVKV